MKKLILGLTVLGLLTSTAYAKHVTSCMSYLVGSSSNMDCSEGYNGKITMMQLIKRMAID